MDAGVISWWMKSLNFRSYRAYMTPDPNRLVAWYRGIHLSILLIYWMYVTT